MDQVPDCLSQREFLFDLRIGHAHHSPNNSSATPDVTDIVSTKGAFISVYLTTCFLLSSDHLPVLIGTKCRLSFVNLPGLPNFRQPDTGPA
jgi:hypothetical protein